MQPENKLSTNLSQKNVDPISFFDKDADFVLVYKKTEKLASAVYMVTSLLPESEPMKSMLRKKSAELVSLTVSYKDTSESTRIDLVHVIKTKVLETVSLLEISFHGGLVSHMNFSVLRQEFSHLIEVISASNFSPRAFLGNTISKSFFENSREEKAVLEASKIPSNSSISEEEAVIKRTAFVDIKDITSGASKEELKRSNRQNIILGLVKKKKELTIKDIAEVIKDCSEKTIQRELNSFIATGVMKRTGVRRWSRYSLS